MAGSSGNRRIEDRKRKNVRFFFYFLGKTHDVYTGDLSRKGAFIQTEVCPPLGSFVILEHYHFKSKGITLGLVGKVRRVQTPYEYAGGLRGVGLEWVRSYCNQGFVHLLEFFEEELGFRPFDDEMKALYEHYERKIVYDFKKESLFPTATELETILGTRRRGHAGEVKSERPVEPPKARAVIPTGPKPTIPAESGPGDGLGGFMFDDGSGRAVSLGKTSEDLSTRDTGRPSPIRPPAWEPEEKAFEFEPANAHKTPIAPKPLKDWNADERVGEVRAEPPTGPRLEPSPEASLDVETEARESLAPSTPGEMRAVDPKTGAVAGDELLDVLYAFRAKVVIGIGNRMFYGVVKALNDKVVYLETASVTPDRMGTKAQLRLPLSGTTMRYMVVLHGRLFLPDDLSGVPMESCYLRIESIDEFQNPGGYRHFVRGLSRGR